MTSKMGGGPYNYSYIFKYIIIGEGLLCGGCARRGAVVHGFEGMPLLVLFALLGDMGVGKSCLLHQFTERKCKGALWWCCCVAGAEAMFLCLYCFRDSYA